MSAEYKNKIFLMTAIAICFIGISGLSFFWLNEYRQASYEDISKFCQIMILNYPETETSILSSLKEYHTTIDTEQYDSDFLAEYGYEKKDFDNEISKKFVIFTLMVFMSISAGIFFCTHSLSRRHKTRIAELTNYLEEINIGELEKIIQTQEDEFSHLEDEIYKTVTTLRQMKEFAESAKQNFAENLTNIAHQLKTKITALSLSVQLYKKSQQTEYIIQIESLLERLNWLEENLLTISKIDAGVLRLGCSKVDMFTALTLAADNLEELFTQNNVSIEIPNQGCVEIDGDLEWTMEALMNLIKNCMEHSPCNGTVHCQYSSNPIYAEIRIWDEGQGFEKEDIPHLFDRFYRGKRASQSGLGIGLSIARSIFELQNGNVTAKNLPNGGACFEIRVYSH